MAPPWRRTDEQRKTHLDASVVPVERALLHRADQIETWGLDGETDPAAITAKQIMAAEFRALAEELHYW